MSTVPFHPNRAMRVHLVDDVAVATSELLLDLVHGGEHLYVALTGGSTPQGGYVHAGNAGADWSGVSLWMSDERVVPISDERSNAGSAERALGEGVTPRDWQLVRTELDPAAAAADYEARIRAELPVNEHGVPVFDLVLLGIGPDGHCASMFPGTDAVTEMDRLVTHVDVPGLEPLVPRVTFTRPLISAATRVVFVVSGASKAAAVRAAFVDEPSVEVPSSLVTSADGSLEVVLDAAAVPTPA